LFAVAAQDPTCRLHATALLAVDHDSRFETS
jgi:hypothetical protein